MNLTSLRELLAKKARSEDLQTLLHFISEEALADRVIESLEKMAINKNRGSHANGAVRDFGTEMDPELEPNMIRESLGHHASRYKAAIAKGDKKLANEHAGHFFRTLDMVHKAEPHSSGKLQVEAVALQPWERNHPSKSQTFGQRIASDPAYAQDNPVTRGKKKPDQFVNDTEGFSFSPRGNDWSFLQGAPHGAYTAEVAKHGHNGAYPMEHTKVNGKYITIDDSVDPHDGNKHHPFDHHPILTHYGESVKKRTPESDAAYRAQRDAYMASNHVARHYEQQESVAGDDQRGKEASAPVHADGPRLDTSKAIRSNAPSSTEADTPMGVDRSHLDVPYEAEGGDDINWDLLPDSLKEFAPKPEEKPVSAPTKPSAPQSEPTPSESEIPDKYKHLFEGK